MTKKAKTKTKSDEAPPKSVPSGKQSTENNAGPGTDQMADAVPPPQVPTPAGAGPPPQLPAAAVQPEVGEMQESPATAPTAPAPSLPDTKSGGSKASEPPVAIAQVPAQMGDVGSTPEKPPTVQAPTQLAALGSPPENPSTALPLAQLEVMGSPTEKPPTAQVPAQLEVVGSTAEKSPAAQAPVELGVAGLPTEKSPAAKQDNTSNREPKSNVAVQRESLKEQPAALQPSSEPLLQPPVSEPPLSPTSNIKTREAPIDKNLKEKDSKPTAPPKVQDSRRDLVDKNQKVSPTTQKAAPNGQPPKQPAEKQNKRPASKETIPSNSIQKADPSVNKPSEIDNKQSSHHKVIQKSESSSEPKTAKDDTVAKVEEVASTQVKDEPNKNQVAGATSEALTQQNSASEASKKITAADPPKTNDTNKNTARGMTENIKSTEKPEISKDPKANGKMADQKVDSEPETQGNQPKPPSPKSDPSEKVNKNAPPKKNKQKNDMGGSKAEGASHSKEVKPVDKGGKKDTTVATGTHPLPDVSKTPNLSAVTENSKESPSNVLLDTMSKLPTLEDVVPDLSAKVEENGNKLNQQTKISTDSKDGKEGPIKDGAQSKSSGKKKNRQQKKSISEEVKPSEVNEGKGPQDVGKLKNNEKKKSAAASPSKEKESNRASASVPAEKNRKNVPGEKVTSGPKACSAKPSTVEKSPVAAEKDSSDKTQVIISESQPEEQGATKKKKRNRHKKKNKIEDGDNSTDANVEGEKQQDKNATAVGGEHKEKTKQQTTTPPTKKSKGKQKDSQPVQTDTSKVTQLVSKTTQDGQASSETPEKQASETTAQTASAKKRNRRRKKGALGIETDDDVNLSQETKSAESKETPVGKPEEQKAKVNIPPTQTRTDETHKKRTDSKGTPKLEKSQQQDGQLSEGTEDQSENFVEVKSKNKRNKKKKLDSAETENVSARPLTSSNNVSKIGPEDIVDANLNNAKGKTEKENSAGDSVKEATNKVAAPKISQEAREQKKLNKKLAERAQLKIQKQIESNALSEVEKSEKYLETITKNLRELTKLRSSKLEDVLQKPGDEEFDYEYTPVQRNTFLATTCHVCKESKQRETMKICEQCRLMSYCSEEHQKSDWSAHKDLCQAISEMCKERGTDNLYAPAVGLSAEEYRGYRMNALLECSAILNRQLEPYEQEIILYPNVCHTCHLPSAANLHTCESCSMVSYCSPEHRPPNHDVWCHDLQLYKSLIIYQSRNGIISPQLPVFLPESFQPPSSDMQSHLQKLSGGVDASPLERAVLSEIATGPLTALFALQKSNKVSGTTEKLVIHFVGAEWSFEMERADKWEAFLLHLIPSLKSLVLVFVGPEVCSLPPEARGLLQKQSTSCPQCQEKGRTVETVIPPHLFYHEYAASQDFIPPTIICAYNAGLYRPNGHKDVDSWSDTVAALLKDPGVPVAVTSYTAEEVLKDAERLQCHRPLNFILAPSQNPYRSLRPNRNFASDDVTPVIFKNYYIMIATSLTQ